jgi:two-component system response regulator
MFGLNLHLKKVLHFILLFINLSNNNPFAKMNDKIVLLVEDNPDDVHLTLHAFNKLEQKIKLNVVNDGVQAMDYLLGRGIYAGKNSAPLPSLILLDLKMPRINGLEVLQQIRNNILTQFIPVVILTSSKEEQDIIDCYSLNANSYIRKPIDFEQFSRTIQVIADYWLILNDIPTKKELY